MKGSGDKGDIARKGSGEEGKWWRRKVVKKGSGDAGKW